MEEYRKLITNVLDHFQYISFDKSHAWHRDMVCLYCSIVEYSETLYFLGKGKKGVVIPLVIRSLLEAFVDLKNLCANRKYGYYLQASDIAEWLRVTKEAGKLENPYLDGMTSATGFEEQVSLWEKELDGLQNKGYSKLSHFEKFKMAGMENEYRSVYNFLCSYSHNSIRALSDRHIEFNEDKSDFKMIMFSEVKTDEVDLYLSVGKQCLVESSKLVHTALETGYDSVFDDTIQIF